MPGHYGDRRPKGKRPSGQLKLNMQKMPPEVQKKLMAKNPKMPAKVAKAISKNMKKK